jgi:uncharacterized membrane protein YqaE (UPF0057 family)
LNIVVGVTVKYLVTIFDPAVAVMLQVGDVSPTVGTTRRVAK